ncbi:pantoate--beta-alanine ligase [Sphingomonas panacisoli]|uniref:Pantothenate synthetase n=1 Tax=Sphingomonas panacisoli TaxID=1813879 RepID=A0A5B8LKZ9_9SPHN|nr:pantoate--beta-alanine ligase [Sphingomonas panacisoli]QDZ08877.1 pantoate--beta-alanine ligase [Sphingomonas panacisoli]
MRIVHKLSDLRRAVAGLRGDGAAVALVPTMGALHAGHMALVEAAQASGAKVVASIFVNPKQFGPTEDLARYPRPAEADTKLLTEHGCDLLWMPGVDEMYPAGFATNVSVSGVSDGLDGAARPGHFDGVATVVAKLFNQVRPDAAYFGEKDFQQLAVIRRMVADLDFGLEIVGVPTVRESDGLALSSRNAYLSADERARAVALPLALTAAKRATEAGERGAIPAAMASLAAAGFAIDYVELVDAATLGEPVPGRPRRLLAAARIGTTRLIDNLPVAASTNV